MGVQILHKDICGMEVRAVCKLRLKKEQQLNQKIIFRIRQGLIPAHGNAHVSTAIGGGNMKYLIGRTLRIHAGARHPVMHGF